MGKRSASRIAKTCMALTCRMAAGCPVSGVQIGADAGSPSCVVEHVTQDGRTRRNSQLPTTNSQPLPIPNFQPFPIPTSEGLALSMQLDMETTDWNPKRPYDLRERLFEFGCLVIRLVQYLHTRGLWR